MRRTPKGVEIGRRVRAQRKALGLSQMELASRAAMTAPRLCDLERGQNPRGPAPETLERLAAALGTNVQQLLGPQCAA
jgi:transcriptional regulator with XRE-family HTH domain